MFGRDALTNLKHLISPKLRYMGMEELILDLEIMSNIYQSQIHNLKLARQCVIEDQRPVPDPNINTGDLVLVRDHTSKSFMPKYKTDYHVIRVLGNKVEVNDNNGKMSWFHISDVKKTDMITKLICQLPAYDTFGCKGRLTLIQKELRTLDGHSSIKTSYLTLLTFQIFLLQQQSRDLTQCNLEVQKCKRSPSII